MLHEIALTLGLVFLFVILLILILGIVFFIVKLMGG